MIGINKCLNPGQQIVAQDFLSDAFIFILFFSFYISQNFLPFQVQERAEGPKAPEAAHPIFQGVWNLHAKLE